MHVVSALKPPLVALRVQQPFDAVDVAALAADVRRALTKGGSVTFCSDLRSVGVLSPTTADALIELLRQDNPAVEKAAIFVQSSAVFSLQIKRIVDAAGHVGRRVFGRKEEGIDWLVQGLGDGYRADIEAFLKGG